MIIKLYSCSHRPQPARAGCIIWASTKPLTQYGKVVLEVTVNLREVDRLFPSHKPQDWELQGKWYKGRHTSGLIEYALDAKFILK